MTNTKAQKRLDHLRVTRYWEDALAAERYADPRHLSRHGRKVYSQTDEDGLIAEIFQRIGAPAKTFFEFGVGDGLECNSAWLLMNGWRGTWIEGDEASCKRIREAFAHCFADETLRLEEKFITAENIDGLVARSFGKSPLDLLSIDIDGNDYWVWEAIKCVEPRVVIVEYNATWPPPAAITVPYEPERSWNRTNYYGASLAAFTKLGAAKGYSLVGCSFSGLNAFLVRNDLLEDKFYEPGNASVHFEPARFFMAMLIAGHPPGAGPLVSV